MERRFSHNNTRASHERRTHRFSVCSSKQSGVIHHCAAPAQPISAGKAGRWAGPNGRLKESTARATASKLSTYSATVSAHAHFRKPRFFLFNVILEALKKNQEIILSKYIIYLFFHAAGFTDQILRTRYRQLPILLIYIENISILLLYIIKTI